MASRPKKVVAPAVVVEEAAPVEDKVWEQISIPIPHILVELKEATFVGVNGKTMKLPAGKQMVSNEVFQVLNNSGRL